VNHLRTLRRNYQGVEEDVEAMLGGVDRKIKAREIVEDGKHEDPRLRNAHNRKSGIQRAVHVHKELRRWLSTKESRQGYDKPEG
jgi:hypothetical protein